MRQPVRSWCSCCTSRINHFVKLHLHFLTFFFHICEEHFSHSCATFFQFCFCFVDLFIYLFHLLHDNKQMLKLWKVCHLQTKFDVKINFKPIHYLWIDFTWAAFVWTIFIVRIFFCATDISNRWLWESMKTSTGLWSPSPPPVFSFLFVWKISVHL